MIIRAKPVIVALILPVLIDVKRLTNAKMKIFAAKIQIVSIPTDPIIAFAMMVMKDLFYLS